VATVDASTGRITVRGSPGRFQLNEVVEWNGGANTAQIGYHLRGWDAGLGGTPQGSDFVVDDITCLIGEDVDRLVLLIPQPASSLYMLVMYGKFWDSGEGHGRMDGYFAGTAEVLFGGVGSDASGGFIDGRTELFAHKTTLMQSSVWQLSGMPILSAGSDPQQSAVQQMPFWGNIGGGQEIDHATRPTQATAHNPNRLVSSLPEFLTLPSKAYRQVGTPGSWAGNGALVLHLDAGGRCIEFNNSVLTP
jgi:hypothetical protein